MVAKGHLRIPGVGVLALLNGGKAFTLPGLQQQETSIRSGPSRAVGGKAIPTSSSLAVAKVPRVVGNSFRYIEGTREEIAS